MSKTIVSFAPHKTALTISILFAVSSFFFLIPMVLAFSFMPSTDADGNPMEFGPPMAFFLAMPVFYLIFGYISTAIGAWLYNRVAKFTGGIQVNVVDSSSS
jgi:hypothetical protein